jgi:hypothetical protein
MAAGSQRQATHDLEGTQMIGHRAPVEIEPRSPGERLTRMVTVRPDASDETARLHDLLRVGQASRGAVTVDYPLGRGEIAVEVGLGEDRNAWIVCYISKPGRVDIPEDIPQGRLVWIRCYGFPRHTAVAVTVETHPLATRSIA